MVSGSTLGASGLILAGFDSKLAPSDSTLGEFGYFLVGSGLKPERFDLTPAPLGSKLEESD